MDEIVLRAQLKNILGSPYLYSNLIIQTPLKGYQLGPVQAVVESCLRGAGREFLWVFPRQSGKDEAIAQLCAFLLLLFHRTEAGIVHTYPTKGQLAVGVDRLEQRLENLCSGGYWWKTSKPLRRGMGGAQVSFFSGNPQAKVEGATASLLLIVNETQDQDEMIISRRFEPMRASANATMLYVGTIRTTSDYLWRVKERLEKQTLEDGLKRVFLVSPETVGAENAAYAAFVENQVRSKGRTHPTVKTELFNEPLEAATGLFPERRRAMMLGKHARLRAPLAGESYLALIDVGGQDEGVTHSTYSVSSGQGQGSGPSTSSPFGDFAGFRAGAQGGLQNPERDYTVCTVVRVVRGQPSPPTLLPQGEGSRDREGNRGGTGEGSQEKVGIGGWLGPRYEVVDVMVELGTRHFQEGVGRPSLFNKTLAYLRHWNVSGVICDQTGLGQGFTDALKEAYKRPTFGFTFSSLSKARLGNDFLAVVETGRFGYFKDGVLEPGSDAWWFFIQCEFCSYELAAGVPLERGLRWGVSPGAKITITNVALPVHDDRLLSAALVAEADRLYRAGELFLSTGESFVIRRDVMGEIDRGGWS